jgi:hypothetical protein
VNKNIKLLLLSLLTLTTRSVIADETTYGLGAAINDGIKIYFPINTDNYLIEPSIFITSDESQFDSQNFTSNDEFETFEVAIGLFRYKNIQADTFLYYGARLGYRSQNRKSVSIGTGSLPFSDTQKNTEDSYIIAPTLGAEYKFTSNFSLGIDLSLEYLSTTQETSTDTFSSDVDLSSYKTKAEIIIRYRF